jgi:hypothetical protein
MKLSNFIAGALISTALVGCHNEQTAEEKECLGYRKLYELEDYSACKTKASEVQRVNSDQEVILMIQNPFWGHNLEGTFIKTTEGIRAACQNVLDESKNYQGGEIGGDIELRCDLFMVNENGEPIKTAGGEKFIDEKGETVTAKANVYPTFWDHSFSTLYSCEQVVNGKVSLQSMSVEPEKLPIGQYFPAPKGSEFVMPVEPKNPSDGDTAAVIPILENTMMQLVCTLPVACSVTPQKIPTPNCELEGDTFKY